MGKVWQIRSGDDFSCEFIQVDEGRRDWHSGAFATEREAIDYRIRSLDNTLHDMRTARRKLIAKRYRMDKRAAPQST
jgi:hypothetical protein